MTPVLIIPKVVEKIYVNITFAFVGDFLRSVLW